MKTLKNSLFVLALLVTTMSFATEKNGISDTEGRVTILQENGMVRFSLLNLENYHYKLAIYSSNGNVVYKGNLGNKMNLAKAFDFANVDSDTYTFKLTTAAGERSEYEVQI